MGSWRRFVWMLVARIPYAIRRRIGELLIILGVLGFLGPFVAILAGSAISNSVELPLSDVSDIALDSEGNIYVGSQAYGRLHKYDANGTFLLSTHVPAAGGAFHLSRQRDELVIAPVRTRTRLVFDSGLTLVSERPPPELYFDLERQSSNVVQSDASGAQYVVRDFFYLCPSVVRSTASGERVLVRSPFYLWPLTGPLPAFLFIVVGTVVRS